MERLVYLLNQTASSINEEAGDNADTISVNSMALIKLRAVLDEISTMAVGNKKVFNASLKAIKATNLMITACQCDEDLGNNICVVDTSEKNYLKKLNRELSNLRRRLDTF